MISKTYACPHRQSENVVLNGKNASGQQRYKCKAGAVTRVLVAVQASKRVAREQVTQTYTERNSFRSTARLVKVSHTTVRNWLKKSASGSGVSNQHVASNAGIGDRRGGSFHLSLFENKANTALDSSMSSDPTNSFFFYGGWGAGFPQTLVAQLAGCLVTAYWFF